MSIPIYLLTGTLGSGKTTLLNNLLKIPKFKNGNTCLIINEFGDLGIDGELVDSGDHPIFELNKGSLFCICIKTDFIATLRTIADDVKPDCLLVEATGMAEPRDVQDFIDVPELVEAFHVEANLCVVDAMDFIRIAPMLRAARQQATWADTLLINKCDLVDDSELNRLEVVLRDMNSDAPISRTEFGVIPENFLDDVTHRVLRGDPLIEPPDPVFAESFSTDVPVDRQRFETSLRSVGDHLLRLKGQVDFGNGPEYYELAGGKLLTSADKSIGRIAGNATAFIAIGWRIRQREFRDAIETGLTEN